MTKCAVAAVYIQKFNINPSFMGTEKRNVLALRGKYCKDCIIYTEDVDDNAIEIVGGGNHFMEYDEGGDGVAHLHRG